jgi:septal ring-binding cell division protein DamX
VEYFLARAQQFTDAKQIYIYSWPVDGKTGYRVAYGLYESLAACREAIGSLPDMLRRYQPYPETIGLIRSQSLAARAAAAGRTP